jgi:hypothetical protein
MARIKDITIDGTLTGTERLVSTDADLSTKNITVDTLKQFILTGQGTALTFPSSTGSNGQILITNGSNVLDWGYGLKALTTSGSQNAAAGNPSVATLSSGTLNIPDYSIALTTSGSQNAAASNPGLATLSSGTLNVPDYSITLTTTGTSGVATLSAGTLNIPQYGGLPVGNNTEIQFNNSGAFGASSALTWSGTLLSATALTTTGVIQNEKVSINGNTIGPSAGNTTEGVVSTSHKVIKNTASASPVDLSSSYFDTTFVFSDAGAPKLNIPDTLAVPLGTHVILSFTGAAGAVTSGGGVTVNGNTNANIAVAQYLPKHLINIAIDTWVLG